jgi:hypothetical protein
VHGHSAYEQQGVDYSCPDAFHERIVVAVAREKVDKVVEDLKVQIQWLGLAGNLTYESQKMLLFRVISASQTNANVEQAVVFAVLDDVRTAALASLDEPFARHVRQSL